MESQGLKNPPHPAAAQQPPQLFIGDLDPQVNESQLHPHLQRFGPVNHIRIIRSFKNPNSLNYALVSFTQPEASVKAQHDLDGEVINGRHIRVVKFTQERSQEANIFVKNIPETVTSKELRDYFSLYGNIISCKVVYDDQGRPLRYGFIQFENKEKAQDAITQKNSSVWLGQTITVSKFLPVNMRIDSSPHKNLYVRGFPITYTEEEVHKKFSQYGEVLSVALMKSKSGLPYGFICFNKEEDSEAALALNNVEEDGFNWYVVPHMKKNYRMALLREKYNKQVELWKRVNLYIRGLPTNIDEEKLQKLCEQFGEITSVKICKSENIKFEALKYDAEGRPSNQDPSMSYTFDASGNRVPDNQITKEMTSRGVAFVCFKTEEALKNAYRGLAMQTIEGKKIFVASWKPREELRKIIVQSKMKKQMKFIPMGGYNPMQMGRGYQNRPFGQQNQMGRGRGIPQQHPMGGPNMFQQNPRLPPPHMQPHHPQVMNPPHQPAPMPQMVSAQRPPVPDLTKIDPVQQKQVLGENLYHLVIQFSNAHVAGKITGMLLEMSNEEILTLLSNHTELKVKVTEAISVLKAAWSTNPEQLKLLATK